MKIDKIAILNDISSNNINLISFLDTFAKFSQNTEDIEEFMYLNENISQSFFKLTDLKKEDLEDILDILKLIKDKSKKEDLDIYGEEVERGINEVNWLIEEKNLYQNIFQEFDNKKVKDLKLPKKVLIVGIRSGGKEFIPNGETVVKSGDQLVIMTDHETAKKYSHELKERGMKMK